MADKTNVMRLLDAAHVDYTPHWYDDDRAYSGMEVAQMLGQDPDCVFKTLVTLGKSGQHYVFMVPTACELNLKKAAAAVHEKSVAMVKSKELLGLTGYIHGGCSPIGMKKFFPTTIDETVELCDHIMCSGGQIGTQVELSFEGLSRVIEVQVADITNF